MRDEDVSDYLHLAMSFEIAAVFLQKNRLENLFLLQLKRLMKTPNARNGNQHKNEIN